MSAKLKSKIQNAFQMHGFCLRSDSSRYLVEALSSVDEVMLEECLDRLVEYLQKETLECNVIEVGDIERAVGQLRGVGVNQENKKPVLEVINVFDLDKFKYYPERKKFLKETDQSLSLIGRASDKARLYRDRYSLISQRVMRHEIFTPVQPGMSEEQKKNKFKLSPVEYLQSCTTKMKGVIVLGMITELKEGKYYLEDPTGIVLMDRTDTVYHKGLITEGSYVLAEGSYEDGVFYVSALGLPPVEPAKVTRAFFGSLNMFGSGVSYSSTEMQRLKRVEEEHRHCMFIILSDVWLDKPEVMDKLRVLFSGYYQSPPTCFILCGNFTSTPYGDHQAQVTQAGFSDLANIISHYPALVKHSQFIFIPGPGDVGAGTVMPRPPLPQLIQQPFQTKLPSSIFTSNPCHIQYCSQQLVVCRGEMMARMARNALSYPHHLDQLPSLYIKSLISQAHLSPLPIHMSPVYWCYDHALNLYPIPDLLVTAERADPFTIDNPDYHCLAINPGSFSQNKYCFQVYWPASKKVEDSQIQE